MQISFKWSKLAFTLLLVLIIVNLAYLNYLIIISRPRKEAETQTNNNFSPVSRETFSQQAGYYKEVSPLSSSSADLAPIFESMREATASLTQKVDTLSKTIGSIKTSTPTQNPQNRVREYIVPIGSGSSTAGDWTDIKGVEAYIDPKSYGVIKEIYFEAGLSVPTGNGRVYARLRNVTDNIGLVESEIYQEGTGGLVSSGRLPVPNTTKLYRVQLKSTLGANVLIENARMKIYVE